ncbi:MAG: hypothetical protein HYT40_03615 [Candidatus Sungbacteria bacterium]|uniref:Phosphomannomutase/phosphoglucomutase n=1 Tax=Candidatus Sungiibacteriota bacterium TaxID=2750080 RepID=A0A931SC61_9BACT|nr:hypothetical protein [Candidatus Sungbacteria bacterium]
MRINPAIFRAYDIRGIYPSQLNAEVARRVGFAFTEFIKQRFRTKKPQVMVARDVRESSIPLRQGLVEGIIGAGFKLFMRGGQEIGLNNGLRSIRGLARQAKLAASAEIGHLIPAEGEAARYVKRLQALMPRLGPLRALVDAAGGSAAYILPKLLTPYHINYKPLYFDPDPLFRNHEPNPLSPRVAEIIRQEFQRGKFQLGVVFDGDGDRAEFFDERGHPIRTDIIFALLAAEELKKKQGAHFVFELTHSRFLGPFIEAYGGKLFVSKVGGIHVRREMERTGAVLGGELSGHIYYKKLLGTDSALYSMLRVFSLVSKAVRPLSELARQHTSGVFLQVSIKHNAPRRALEAVLKQYRPHLASRLDGITVQYPSWWFNIRMSNTEPLLRLTIEAGSESELKARRREVEGLIA